MTISPALFCDIPGSQPLQSQIALRYWKPLCHLPFAKGKTGGSCFLKICFHKGAAIFFKPFRIGVATFLAFYWYRCGYFFRGGKLALVKGRLHFLDPFDIGVATFLEISISNSVFYIWNLMGSILESMTYFWPISIFGLQLCHIMASNGNKDKNRVQWEHYDMWIQLGRATIKIQPKFGLCKFFIAGFLQIFCIYLNKERSYW